MKGAAATAGGIAAVSGGAGAVSAAPAAEGEKARAASKPVRRIHLFMHPPSTLSMRDLSAPNPVVEENWKKIIREKGSDAESVVCIVESGAGDKELVAEGRRCFGDRCIVNPSDNSTSTLVLLARDLDRALSRRGNHGEWNLYEIWSSNNARRWAEGFKKELAKRGYAYDPKQTSMETFGNWTGCHHKYSNFMAVYLGLTCPAVIHAECELSSLKSFPMPPSKLVEVVRLDRHVLGFVFLRKDGCPMAQFWDGLRPVWDPPHTATVKIGGVEAYTFSPNELIPSSGASRVLKGKVIADVGDGCHPAYTTIVGRGKTAETIKAFRAAVARAEIAPRDEKLTVFRSVGI
ncbi:MAG: hypothetical protein JXQ73_27935 [Phycisphaerae bacterium]|nr:hypothetical protein [Phycisphaerae bacterium]